jgi:hypothetical protein
VSGVLTEEIPATLIKYQAKLKSYVLIGKNDVIIFGFRDVAQSGSVLRSGRRGRWFESSHPDLARRTFSEGEQRSWKLCTASFSASVPARPDIIMQRKAGIKSEDVVIRSLKP